MIVTDKKGDHIVPEESMTEDELARFLVDYRNGAYSWADDPYKAAAELCARYQTDEDVVDLLEAKIEFLMKHYVVSESGFFAFADGEVWECQKGPTNGPTEREIIAKVK